MGTGFLGTHVGVCYLLVCVFLRPFRALWSLRRQCSLPLCFFSSARSVFIADEQQP